MSPDGTGTNRGWGKASVPSRRFDEEEIVIPAKLAERARAGIQNPFKTLDTGFRRYDGNGIVIPAKLAERARAGIQDPY